MNGALRSMILRAKVLTSRISGRTLVQTQVLDEDTHETIELCLPPGYVASPIAGSDVIELQMSGFASHKVLLGGDNTADALADLQVGEHGLSTAATGQQLILRVTGTEIVTALLKWGPARDALKRLIHEEFQPIYNTHRHSDPQGGTTGVPDQLMTDAHLTGGS